MTKKINRKMGWTVNDKTMAIEAQIQALCVRLVAGEDVAAEINGLMAEKDAASRARWGSLDTGEAA